MFLLVQLNFFTRVALVSFLQHPCRTCDTLVLLMSHSYCTRVVLMSHSCRLCRTRVVRVWYACCKLEQIVFAFLRYLNVIMSNEVEKVIKYIYVMKLLLRNNFAGCTVGARRWHGLMSLFFFLGKNVLYFLMLNLHSFLTLR